MEWRQIVYTGVGVFVVAALVGVLDDPWQSAGAAGLTVMVWLYLWDRTGGSNGG